MATGAAGVGEPLVAEPVGDEDPEVGGDTVLEDVHAASANAASTAAILRDPRIHPPSNSTVHPATRFPQSPGALGPWGYRFAT
jgi:hypothetical protein